MRKWKVIVISTIIVFALGAAEVALAIKFAHHELRLASLTNRPNITFTRPSDGETNILPTIYISCDLNLPNTGAGVKRESLFNGALKLYRTKDKQLTPMHFNTSGGGDSIVATPDDLLEPSTQYTFEVTDGVKDTSGARFVPFSLNFTTAAGAAASDYPVAFEKVSLHLPSSPQAKGPTIFTALAIGPDHRLYAATYDGRIVRIDIDALTQPAQRVPGEGQMNSLSSGIPGEGRGENLSKPGTRNPKPDQALTHPSPEVPGEGYAVAVETIHTVQAANHGPRLITGITFDPASTTDNPILWVSHGEMALQNATDWTGKISVIRGPKLDQYQDIVTGLPRAYRDHLNFQMAFGPDGAIYFCQGSMTSVGGPDKKWNLRHEHLLSAACLRLDPKLVTLPPLDVKTEEGGTYDPTSTGAPLTIYATGIRSGFDLLWHRNGNLYTGLNGAAAGGLVLAGPHSPAIDDIKETTDDLLLKVVKGGYYGHPNEKHNQFVLMGGNPTTQPDPQEIKEYPVGTMPEPNFTPPAYDFGKSVSPNGLCEYIGGPLDGKILVTRFSGGKDIVVLSPGADGNIAEAIIGIDGFTHFSDPLDLIEDTRTGNIYVAEYAGQQLTLLKPTPGGVSKRVFKQTIASAP